ncbi:glycosyltransferase family 1 protein [soil metagenome]
MAQKSDFRGSNIVCFSTADWDTLLPTNKHQLMRRFAKRGARVLYLETLGTRAPKLGSGTDLTRIAKRLARGFSGAKRREKNLWTASPVVMPRWKTAPQIKLNQIAFNAQLGSVLPEFEKPIAWVYSPYAVHLIDAVKPSVVVYHMVDDLSAVPGADVEAICDAEVKMIARADVIFCTERSLFDRAKRINANSHFMPNVADYEHFSRAGKTKSRGIAKIKSLPRPRIVFSGNLAPHKVDFKLCRELAKRSPRWQWVFIGPVWEGARSRDFDALTTTSNVTMTGHVPYEDLPAWLHEADVLVIPYAKNEATNAVFPLKLFEYLATGKPVVSSAIPSITGYSPAIKIARTADGWIRAIEDALRDSEDFKAQRIELARRNNWERRIEEMWAEVTKLFTRTKGVK